MKLFRIFGGIGGRGGRRLLSHLFRQSKWFGVNAKLEEAVLKSANVAHVKDEFRVGEVVHGFTVTKVQDVPELCLTAVRLCHNQTKADYLHLARDDGNNVFSVGFRTAPLDSTGVPHILEHTTLCGSQHYPCRDPFFKMLNRSLSTFMNAFTGSDYTMYPFSTQNLKDFENLQRVYLDAVFQPLLRELDFLQEGWRLEHEDVNDKESPIIFKGVVFNEMKGAFADSDSIFSQNLQNKLLPSHTYSYVSGGDPLCIPNLTWEHLKQFHATHYHPSNSKIFSYGNFPLSNHLRVLDDYLSKFSQSSPNTAIPDEKLWVKPRTDVISCNVDPLLPNPDKQTTVSVSYLLNSILDQSETFITSVLGELLTTGPNSPFYKALLEPNIGSGYSPCTGFNGGSKTTHFTVGLKGIAEKDVAGIIGIIDKTIDDVIRNGFPKERIDAILHTIELSLKHQTSNFGLAILMGLYSSWNHDGDPIAVLRVNDMVSNFKAKLENNPRFLQDKVQEYFKDSAHKLTLIMHPKEDYQSRQQKAEESLLAEKLAALSERDRQNIFIIGKRLLDKQNEREDGSVLPTLKVSDIDSKITPAPIQQSIIGSVPVQLCMQPTNNLTYFRAVLSTKNLNEMQKKLVPLFCHVLTRMGTQTTDYKTFSHRVDMTTGGLDATPHLRLDATNSGLFEEAICLHSYALDHNTDAMMSLWTEIFQSMHFSDLDLLKTLINDLATDLAVSLPDSGHRYAIAKARSSLSPFGALNELYSGIQQIVVMKTIAESQDLSQLACELQQLANECLTKDHMRVAINAMPSQADKSLLAMDKFISLVSGSPTSGSLLTKADGFKRRSCRQHIILPFPVNFVCKTYPAVNFCHDDFAKLHIMSMLMSTKFLHKEVREKGGAYGAGALLDAGTLALYSYRDPNNLETLKTFDDAVNWVLDGDISQQDIDEAKLMAFSNFDRPVAPGSKGMNLFLNGVTDEQRQKHRENLFRISQQDIKDACSRYMKRPQCTGEVILGPKSEATMDGSWNISENHD